ncbi:MAG: hypothetical protein HQ521_12890 [Bacteroidetes bacterium]|nr:hypothetical protein [Bacteroidota bacterium]
MMKDSQKEAEHDHKPGSGILGRQVYKNGKKALTNLDRSTTRYISRGQPLTKSMYTRLERLEAAGYIKIEDLQSRRDIANALGNHNDKLNLTRYDLNLGNKISENCVEPQDNPRVTRLLDEGYLTRDKNNKLLTSEKFIITAQRLIQKELLDTRNYTTITCSTKKRALQVTDDREHTTYLSPDREIKRSLNEDQIRLIKTLKTFSNMSEHQIYDLYQQAGQDIYFANELNDLL